MALGSNTEADKHMGIVQERLCALFAGIRFTETLCTEPVGLPHSPCFLNVLAVFYTALPYRQVTETVKALEQVLGATKDEKRRGVVRMDIDVLLFGTDKHHTADWSRPYLQTLLGQAAGL